MNKSLRQLLFFSSWSQPNDEATRLRSCPLMTWPRKSWSLRKHQLITHCWSHRSSIFEKPTQTIFTTCLEVSLREWIVPKISKSARPNLNHFYARLLHSSRSFSTNVFEEKKNLLIIKLIIAILSCHFSTITQAIPQTFWRHFYPMDPIREKPQNGRPSEGYHANKAPKTGNYGPLKMAPPRPYEET